MKQFIARIGYADYAVGVEDAPALLGIMSRMRSVAQKSYSGPYFLHAEQACPLDSLSMADVLDEPPAEPPKAAAPPLAIAAPVPALAGPDDSMPF